MQSPVCALTFVFVSEWTLSLAKEVATVANQNDINLHLNVIQPNEPPRMITLTVGKARGWKVFEVFFYITYTYQHVLLLDL
jgi:hypothetical protein